MIKGTDLCPAANKCHIVLPEYPQCGSDVAHLSPTLQVEELCSRALKNQLEEEEARIPEGNLLAASTHDVNLAWLSLECARLPDVSAEEAEDYFDDARIYASRVLEDSRRQLQSHLDAQHLLLFLPVFRALLADELITEEDEMRIDEGLAELVTVVREAEVHTQATHPGHIEHPDHKPCLWNEVWRSERYAELGALMIAQRADFLTVPASRREQGLMRNSDRGTHDFQIVGSIGRLPVKVQQRFKSRSISYFADHSLVIEFQEFTGAALSSLGEHPLREQPTDERTATLVNDLVREIMGEQVEYPEVLEKMTEHFTRRVERRAARNPKLFSL